MESQPQNPEFRINPENFRPCVLSTAKIKNGFKLTSNYYFDAAIRLKT